MSYKFKLSFFQQETTRVAEEILGQTLIRITDQGICLKGRIVETEAYLGLKDDSCHSFGGRRTKRTQVMYQAGGHAYVYWTYGMYYCFNIVTAGLNEPEAVLIRALQPLKGVKNMQKNRLQATQHTHKNQCATPATLKKYNIFKLTTGPGKLCQALNIQKSLNGVPMNSPNLYVEKGEAPCVKDIAVGHRIGLSPFKSSAYWPLRFYIKTNPFVSTHSPPGI